MFRKEFQAAVRLKFLPVFFIFAFAPSASAQLTHVDTMLAVALWPMLPVVDGVPATPAGDSSIQLLSTAMLKTTFSVTPIFYVTQLSATAQHTDSGARMDIHVEGELLQTGNALAIPRTLARTMYFPFQPRDWAVLENNGSRYVHLVDAGGAPPGGLWSNWLEDAIVLIGAIAVGALFFSIKS